MIQRDAFLESILSRPAYKIDEFTDPVELKLLQDKNYNFRGSFFYTKVDCSNASRLRVFENSGFKIIEENITLEKERVYSNLKDSFSRCQQYKIRWAQDEERNFVEDIARKKISLTIDFIKTQTLTIPWPMKSRGNGLGIFFQENAEMP